MYLEQLSNLIEGIGKLREIWVLSEEDSSSRCYTEMAVLGSNCLALLMYLMIYEMKVPKDHTTKVQLVVNWELSEDSLGPSIGSGAHLAVITCSDGDSVPCGEGYQLSVVHWTQYLDTWNKLIQSQESLRIS